MKYLVIGAGGVGGALAFMLKRGNKDVTLLARGKHLAAIQKNGLTLKTKSSSQTLFINACEDSWEKKDVIFICVKDYSLNDIMPLVKRACHKNTVVIPLLNIYGTGEKINPLLSLGEALNGCVYITSEKEDNGVIYMSGEIFRVVFGNVNGDICDARYKQIEKDLTDCSIRALLSPQVRKDTLKKYVFIAPMAAAAAYLDCEAAAFKKTGLAQTLFLNCTEEICLIAKKMGIDLGNMKEKNLSLMNAVSDDYLCSMHKDIRQGTQSEIDGLVFNVVRLAKEYKVKAPTFEKISEHFGFRIGCDCENRVEISSEIC